MIKNEDITSSSQLQNFPYRFLIIDEKTGGTGREQLRGWFDGANDFLGFCATRFDAITMMKNIVFDQNKESLHQNEHYITKMRYDILLKILEMDLQKISLPQKAIIYGVGNIGRQFYLRIKDKCEVVAFVDKMLKGTTINNLSVLDLKELEYEGKVPFIVTATYDFDSIYNQIKQYDKDAIIISLEEIIEAC